MNLRTLLSRFSPPDRSDLKQWLKSELFEMREVSTPNGKRFAWFSDDNRRVSTYYRFRESAVVKFGEWNQSFTITGLESDGFMVDTEARS